MDRDEIHHKMSKKAVLGELVSRNGALILEVNMYRLSPLWIFWHVPVSGFRCPCANMILLYLLQCSVPFVVRSKEETGRACGIQHKQGLAQA